MGGEGWERCWEVVEGKWIFKRGEAIITGKYVDKIISLRKGL